MPEPIGRSNSNPYTFDPNTCSEPTAVDGPPPDNSGDNEPCSEPTDPAVAQLTSKYKPDLNAFLATQTNEPETSPAAARTETKLAQTRKAIEYAQLAQSSYSEQGAAPGWHRFEAEELEAAGLDPKAFNDPESGFKAALDQNEKTGEFVLAFAGTEDGTDWGTNLAQGLGYLDAQYRQAAQLGVSVTDAVGTTTMVGHSLGGGLAATAAVATRSEAVTFNAAGVHANTIEYARTASEPGTSPIDAFPTIDATLDRFAEWHAHGETDKHVTNYSVLGEILTSGQSLVPVPEAQGKQIDLPPAGPTTIADTVDLHYIEPVIDALRGRETRLSESLR